MRALHTLVVPCDKGRMGTAEDAGTAQGRWLRERGLSGLAGGGRRRAAGVGCDPP